MIVRLPRLIWHGNTFLEADFPDFWDLTLCPMEGAEAPALSPEKIREAVRNPVGSPRLAELARGKKRVVILFDDMTRPTRAYEILPAVLEELKEAEVKDEAVTFVCSLGTHGALTFADFRKKLGSEVIERFRVFNHNIYENCMEVGVTSRGTRLSINREAAGADLLVGIGCVTAHAQAGFSGGGKIILPGIAHIDSITHYHLDVEASARHTTGLGMHEGNVMRQDIEEAAKMTGLKFLVNVLVNGRGETSSLYAGAPAAVHKAAVDEAKSHYATRPLPSGMDFVVSNAFAKPGEMAIAVLLGVLALKNLAGTVAVIAESPEGQVPHYLLGRFGRDYGGRQYPVSAIPPSIDLVIQAPFYDRSFADWFANPEAVSFTRSWPETRALLESRFGAGARGAVIPNATMQYYRFSA